MFFIVMWKNKQYSIVDDKKLRFKRNGKQEAAYKGKYYEVTVLKESEEFEWLETLEVTTDGDVFTKKENPVSSTLARSRDVEMKEIINIRQSVLSQLDKAIIDTPSIFDKADASTDASAVVVDVSPDDAAKNEVYPTSQQNEVKSNEKLKKKSNTPEAHVENKPKIICCPACSFQFTDQNLNFLKKLVHHMEQLKNKNGHSQHAPNSGSEVKPQHCNSLPKNVNKNNECVNMVELTQNSGVLIPYDKLYFIENSLKNKDPRDITRVLLKAIIGDEELINMTLSGKGKKSRTGPMLKIPVEVVDSIKEYVTLKFKRKMISNMGYRTCITAYCNELRQKAKEKNPEKVKEEKADKEKIEEEEEDKTEDAKDKEDKEKKDKSQTSNLDDINSFSDISFTDLNKLKRTRKIPIYSDDSIAESTDIGDLLAELEEEKDDKSNGKKKQSREKADPSAKVNSTEKPHDQQSEKQGSEQSTHSENKTKKEVKGQKHSEKSEMQKFIPKKVEVHESKVDSKAKKDDKRENATRNTSDKIGEGRKLAAIDKSRHRSRSKSTIRSMKRSRSKSASNYKRQKRSTSRESRTKERTDRRRSRDRDRHHRHHDHHRKGEKYRRSDSYKY